MEAHECLQDERVRELSRRVDKLEEKTDNLKETILDLKSQINKLLWGILGTFASTILTLITILLKQ